MNQSQSNICWPDGTPRSQGNAFAAVYRSRGALPVAEPEARRKSGAKHGKALPFSLLGTRVRTL